MKRLLLTIILLTMVVSGIASATSMSFNSTYARQLLNDTAPANWNDMRTAGSATYWYNSPGSDIWTSSTSQKWSGMSIGGITWNTTDLPDNAIITSADIIGYSASSALNDLGSPTYAWEDFNPANKAAFVYADYNKSTFTRMTNNATYASFVTPNSTIIWNLTPAGFGNISKTGYTTFALNNNWSIDNQTPAWLSAKETNAGIRNHTYAGGMYAARLNITYTIGNVTPVASFTSNTTSGFSPLPVGFTDTSTNTPIVWNWTCRNVTGNNTQISFSTLQSPSIIFGAGNFSIVLNASNSAGYNITPGTIFINVSNSATAPVASFTANVTSGSAPLAVGFTDTSLPASTSWSWYIWGNETLSSSSQNPQFTLAMGNYSIRFKATNAYGSTWANQTGMINVSNTSVSGKYYAVNGAMAINWGSTTWSDLRTGSGDDIMSTGYGLNNDLYTTNTSAAATRWGGNYRPIITIDTSTLGANANVVSATLTATTTGFTNTFPGGISPSFAWIDSNPTNPMAIDDPDYNKTTFTRMTNDIAGSAFSQVNGTISWTLTPAGLAAINKIGKTSFILENNWTIDNQEPAWSSQKEVSAGIRSHGYAGGAMKAYLTIYYTSTDAGQVPSTDFTYDTQSCYSPCSIQFTDQSGNSPTVWIWKYSKDGGSYTNFDLADSKNPLQTFTTAGSYSISLTASNTYGSKETNKTNIINVVTTPPILAPIAHFLMTIFTGGNNGGGGRDGGANPITIPADAVYITTLNGDGTDETSKVQLAFNYMVSNGNSSVVFPANTNVTIGSIRFPTGKTFIGQAGSVLTLKANSHTGTSPWTWIYAEPNTNIYGLTFNGNRLAAGNGLNTNGIMLQGGNRFMYNYVTGVNSYSIFTYYSSQTNNVLVANNTVTNSKQYGIETGCSDPDLTNGETNGYCYSNHMTVTNNTITDCHEVGIKIRGAMNAIISNNIVTLGSQIGDTPSGIRLYSWDEQNTNVTITKNTVTGIDGNPSVCINSDDATNWQTKITNNTVSHCHDGIDVSFNNGVVTNNTVSYYTTCITSAGTTGNVLTGNVCL